MLRDSNASHDVEVSTRLELFWVQRDDRPCGADMGTGFTGGGIFDGPAEEAALSTKGSLQLSVTWQPIEGKPGEARRKRILEAGGVKRLIAMLQARYPEQVRKQLQKLRQAAGNDAPAPLKGHTRFMLVVKWVHFTSEASGS